jgi:6-pyruvoyltetrahydropterin/6-carboxytetrahydropterin synthase
MQGQITVSNECRRASYNWSMFITRKAEFSASHFCRLASLNEDQNRALFGDDARPSGHGHNFVVEVSVEGEPDAVTGMIVDLKELKDILEREIVNPMDHRFLNFEVEPFGKIVPTAPNIALEIWRRLEKEFEAARFRLARVRLFETPDLYVDVVRPAAA